MPEFVLDFSLEGKSPAELEARRRELVSAMTTRWQGYDDPELPEAVLRQLAHISGALRRRTSGPPKTPKPPKGTPAPKPTLDSLLS